jgi:hypothetical protein
MLLENSNFFKNCFWHMVDGVTEELASLSAITFIKMSYLSFASSTLHFSMDSLDRYSFWIGCPCFIIFFGHHGLASLPMFLKEM